MLVSWARGVVGYYLNQLEDCLLDYKSYNGWRGNIKNRCSAASSATVDEIFNNPNSYWK